MQPSVKREPIEPENIPPAKHPKLSDGSNLTNLDYPQQSHSSHSSHLISLNQQSSSSSVALNVPTEPIDMHDQEKQKLERKRERNRQAATKCRHRKLERIQQLEDHVRDLTAKNQNLKTERNSLKQQLDELHDQIESQPRLRDYLQSLTPDLNLNHANGFQYKPC